MLDFPNNPQLDDVFRDWRWDGLRWVSTGTTTGGGGDGLDPNDFVRKAGDTMTGQLIIAMPVGNAVIHLRKPDGTPGTAGITGGIANGISKTRWRVNVADNAAEGGDNTGSNFSIIRYADDGMQIGSPVVTIDRATGVTTFGEPLRVSSGPSPTPNPHDVTTRTDVDLALAAALSSYVPQSQIATAAAIRAMGSGVVSLPALSQALAFEPITTTAFQAWVPDYTGFINAVVFQNGHCGVQMPTHDLTPLIGRSGLLYFSNQVAASTLAWATGYTFDRMLAPSTETAANFGNLFCYSILATTRIHINLIGYGLT